MIINDVVYDPLLLSEVEKSYRDYFAKTMADGNKDYTLYR